MATYEELAKFYAAAPSEDAVLQIRSPGGTGSWLDQGSSKTPMIGAPVPSGPGLYSDISLWRWKPELKPVDMTVLVGSGIDCEFCNGEARRPAIGQLTGLAPYYMMEWLKDYDNEGFTRCRPRLKYWFSVDNFIKPFTHSTAIAVDTLIEKLRGAGFEVIINKIDDGDMSYRIGSFAVVGLQKGYCWPWEIKS